MGLFILVSVCVNTGFVKMLTEITLAACLNSMHCGLHPVFYEFAKLSAHHDEYDFFFPRMSFRLSTHAGPCTPQGAAVPCRISSPTVVMRALLFARLMQLSMKLQDEAQMKARCKEEKAWCEEDKARK